MLISLQWLKEYIELDDLSAEQIDQHLTQLGLEVEELKNTPALDKKIVTAEVITKPHPNASKLNLCEVKVSSEETLNIVCGAPNVEAGQKVVLAQIGSQLPNGLKNKS